MPPLGTKIEAEGYIFKVNKIDGHHIQYIEVKKVLDEVQAL